MDAASLDQVVKNIGQHLLGARYAKELAEEIGYGCAGQCASAA